MVTNLEGLVSFANELANESENIIKQYFRTTLTIDAKNDGTPVTIADKNTELKIRELIQARYPDHGILGEEFEGTNIDSEYLWVIDPIDGTSAFACGLPTYSSSIALLKDKEPIVGAIYVAITNEVIWAAKGKGVFADKKRLIVKKVSNLRQATIGFDPAYFEREKVIKKIAAPLSDKVRILPMIWSQAAALALVAQGVLNGYIQCGSPKVWDVAAGKLLVEEAEGVVTDLSGGPLDIFNINGYVAGLKIIHDELLEHTKSAGYP